MRGARLGGGDLSFRQAVPRGFGLYPRRSAAQRVTLVAEPEGTGDLIGHRLNGGLYVALYVVPGRVGKARRAVRAELMTPHVGQEDDATLRIDQVFAREEHWGVIAVVRATVNDAQRTVGELFVFDLHPL